MAGDQEYIEALRGTVGEAKAAIQDMDNPDYARLLELEETGDDRKTLKSFLEEKVEQHDVTTVSSSSERPSRGITISMNQAIVSVFVMGLLTGFVGGIVAPVEVGTPDGTENVIAPSDSGDSGDSGSQISGESTMTALKDIADSVGYDGKKLETCMADVGTDEITEDKSEITNAVGRLGTPSFFIGNSEIGYERMEGAQPYSVMKGTINEQVDEAANGNTEIESDEVTLENVGLEGEPTLGDDSAAVNFIEYSDYGCPWCAEWHGADAIPQRPIDQQDAFGKVRSNHVDNGEIRFILKDFPVPGLHPKAMDAHKAAQCVFQNSRDNYWKFSQKLYEERDKWK